MFIPFFHYNNNNNNNIPSVPNDIETGTPQDDIIYCSNEDDWDIITYTPFTEPFWGIIINK